MRITNSQVSLPPLGVLSAKRSIASVENHYPARSPRGREHRRSLHYAPPDFLLRLVALVKFLRLSLKKAAYVDLVSFAK